MSDGSNVESGPQNKVVSLIPLEIHLEILSYLEPVLEYKSGISDLEPNASNTRNHTIQNLALVCRDFYYHLFPLIFENVYICQRSTHSAKVPLYHVRLCRSIIQGDERARTLATYIRRYSIVQQDPERYEMIYKAPTMVQDLTDFFRALAFMPNLKELYLWKISITDDVLKGIAALPPLKMLRMDNCGVPKPLNNVLLRRFSKLPVTHIAATRFGSRCDVPKERFLSHLCMSRTERLTSDFQLSCHFLHGMTLRPPLTHLSHIYLKCLAISAYPRIMSDLLLVTPALKFLQVNNIDYHVREESVFEPCTDFPRLPQLEHIYAPIPALKSLIPGSFVSSIGITSEVLHADIDVFSPVPYPSDDVFWAECVTIFKSSQRSIEVLDMPLEFYRSVKFAAHFPKLRHLKIRAVPWQSQFLFSIREEVFAQNIILRILGTWDHKHPLQLLELEIVYDHIQYLGGLQSPDQDNMFKIMKKMIPSLQWFTISGTDPSTPTKRIRLDSRYISNLPTAFFYSLVQLNFS